MNGMRRAGHAGTVCAVTIFALLVPATAHASVVAGGEPIIIKAASHPTQSVPQPAGRARFIAYNGVRVTAPAAWPVVDLRLTPRACVRSDQAAVYLGSPGPQSDCPAHRFGRTATIWLKPAPTAKKDRLTTRVVSVGALTARAGVNAISHDLRVQVVAPAVELVATWGSDRSPVDRVLASLVRSSSPSARASRPAAPATSPAAKIAAAAAPAALSAAAGPVGLTADSTFTGMAFDTCAAPAASTMSSWLASPYRAAGIYIGGSVRSCGDGNISAGWVSSVRSMGWGLLPIYLGAQAPCNNQLGLEVINASQAAAQGTASAADAVSRATFFGLGSGAPIYYDMEAYSSLAPGCSQTVITFMSAWTTELHRLGYRSGAYGSSGSLMLDLSQAVGSPGFAMPDAVWFAHWNQLQNTTDSTRFPTFLDAYWSSHQRAHQYSGPVAQSFGGVTMNIDANWVDGNVGGTAVPVSYGADVVGPGSSGFVLTGSMSYWRSGAPDGLRKLAYWTGSNGSTESNGATWSPQLAPGLYDVQANIPLTNSTASAPYTITDALGTTTRVVNQQAAKGYRSLGTYTARAGSPISVHLGDNDPSLTPTQVAVDAMAFRLVATAPGSPDTVSAAAGNGQATVSWTAASANGSPVTGYRVTASPGGATANVNGTTTSTVMSGLTNGTSYTFAVTATNLAGTSPSSSSPAVTPGTLPGAPTGTSATAGNASAGVSWTAPTSNGGSALTGYTVTAAPGGRTASTTGATTATVTGLANGTAYTFTVTATSDVGTGLASVPSASVTPATPPASPASVTATPDDAQAMVSWAPADDGGSAVTGYTVTATPGGASASTTGATTASVTGLANGTSYSFTVTATNVAGTSPASPASAQVTPRTVPGAPTAVLATPGSAAAVVSWTAPTGDGGSAVTEYTVRVVNAATSVQVGALQTAVAGATSTTVTGLTNGAAYRFQVLATNVAGSGPYSALSSPVTLTAPVTRLSDYNRDGFTDLVARDTAGVLWLYPGNGTGRFQTRLTLGAGGWNAMTALVTPGDVTGDGNADLLARDTAGVLWLYPGNGTGALSARRQLGTGWSAYTITGSADLNGAGAPDLLARDAAGVLWLYPFSGNGVLGARSQVGTGWNGFTITGPGDVNGDGWADILARDAAGALWVYPGNGAGGLNARTLVSSGWQAMTALATIGNFDRLAGNDLVTRDAAGALWLYAGDNAGHLGTRTQIGASGWNVMTYIG